MLWVGTSWKMNHNLPETQKYINALIKNSKYLKKFPYLLMAISLGGAFLTPFYLYDDIWAMAIQIMRQGFCLIFAVYIANLFSRDNS